MTPALFSDVCWILRTLKAQGHLAFVTGGAVRDLMLGHPPQDYDIATTASPKEISALFPRVRQVGKSFGTLLIVIGHRPYQVTTLQTSGGTFTDSLERDILRRDFTVNALFWDPLEDRLIDIVGGMEDLRKRVLTPVTDAKGIFRDDPIRMLRAIRLSHSLGFSLHPSILPAMRAMRAYLTEVAPERIQLELDKILSLDRVLDALCPLVKSRVFFQILPETARLAHLDQSPYHDFTALSHTFRTLAHTEILHRGGWFLGERIVTKKPLLMLAALLHDIGKPETQTWEGGIHHFYRHDKVGAEITGGILKRLRFPKRDVQFVKFLVERHMYPLHLFRLREGGGLSERAVRRFQRKVKKDRRLPLLLLSTADQWAKRRRGPGPRGASWRVFCQRLKGE